LSDSKTAGLFPDLHLHTSVSDGTDSPEELLRNVREAGVTVFSVTDHDALKGCLTVRQHLGPGDPVFIPGVEFSCRDGEGRYHILGYDCDLSPSSRAAELVERSHALRMEKAQRRIDALRERGYRIPEERVAEFMALDNPGKPHLGNLLVELGCARTKEEAIRSIIDPLHVHSEYLDPGEVIQGILDAGGVPVLAHPTRGNGGDCVRGSDLEQRVRRLREMGLRGLESWYSEFSPEETAEVLSLAERFGLCATAGSDYHGANKAVRIGQTGLPAGTEHPLLRSFLIKVM